VPREQCTTKPLKTEALPYIALHPQRMLGLHTVIGAMARGLLITP
jgi:hypothetical protein